MFVYTYMYLTIILDQMFESNKLKKPLAKITKYEDKAHLKSLGNFLKSLF